VGRKNHLKLPYLGTGAASTIDGNSKQSSRMHTSTTLTSLYTPPLALQLTVFQDALPDSHG
jgi:hypothetical protein